jgi:hypothetical protein
MTETQLSICEKQTVIQGVKEGQVYFHKPYCCFSSDLVNIVYYFTLLESGRTKSLGTAKDVHYIWNRMGMLSGNTNAYTCIK